MPELPPPPDAGSSSDPWSTVLGLVTNVRRRLGTTGAALGGVLALVVLGTVAWMAFAGPGSSAPPDLELPTVGSSGDPGARPAKAPSDPSDSSGSSATTGSAPTDEVVVVHVAGAVVRPGVYRLAAESRLADALDAAGGPAPDAEPDGVNLAARLTDGERVYLPRKGEVAPSAAGSASPGSASAGAPAGPIDLNSATAADLEALPGVGPATAAAILEYRQQQGRFRSVEELLEVRGIGEAKLAAIRPKVRVR